MSHTHTVIMGTDPGAGIALSVATGSDALHQWPRAVVSPVAALWSVIDHLADDDTKAVIRHTLAGMAVNGITPEVTTTCPYDDDVCRFPDVIHDDSDPSRPPQGP